MADYSNEISRMQFLMGFNNNINESKDDSSAIEYSMEGADGKTYGIIKEGTKYYIKVAPKKNSAVLLEDYDYIGGINEKKKYEYSSYNMASKQFDLKLMSINEACHANKPVVQPTESAEWQVKETKEMRKELDRFNQICENVNNLLSENNAFFLDRPTACGKNAPQGKDSSNPFSMVLTNADMEFDGKKVTDPAKADKTFAKKANAEEDYKGTKHTDPKTADDTFSEKGKKINEGRTFRLTEEQVLAWSKSKDFIDMSKGTKKGSTKPYEYIEEPINEETQMTEFGETDVKPLPAGIGNADGKGEPYNDEVNESDEDNAIEIVINADDGEDILCDDEGCIDLGDEEVEVEDDDEEDDFEDDEEEVSLDDILDDEDADESEIELDLDDDEDLDDEEDDDEEFDFDDEEGDEEIDLDDEEEDFEEIDESINRMMKFPIKTTNKFGENIVIEKSRGDMGGIVYHLDVNNGQFSYSTSSLEDCLKQARISSPTTKQVEVNESNDPQYFGEHPAYSKEPMEYGNYEEPSGRKDWNDESAKGRKRFGLKKGSNFPYTDKSVADAVSEAISRVVKKK